MAYISRKSIVTSALILTAAGIITRVLGFVYRIYMSNMMGAEGMGLYQLIMPVYGLAWSLACSGFNTTVSKLTAQERAKAEYGNMGRVLKQSVIITTTLGLILSLALYFGAQPLSIYFFKDLRTMLPLQILSLAFPCMAAGTCVRGYFIGLQETAVPAVNQVLEQIVRMAVVYLLAAQFIPRGLTYAYAAAVIGIVCEEIFSFFYILISYRYFKKKKAYNKRPSLSPQQCLGMILTMALPLTANRVTGSLLATWENVLIPGRLQLFGLSAKEAMSEFGRINGMAMPLIFFPTAVLTALSVTLVPAVSEAAAVKNLPRIAGTASKAVLFASITGMGAACLFIFFPDELGMAIYHQPIGQMLTLLGAMCPLIYVQIVLSGILNGLGCQMFIFRNSILSSIINIICIYFFVPLYGLNAFIIGWFISLILVCALEIDKIRKNIALETAFMNWLVKPLLAAAMAGLSARLLADRWLFTWAGPLAGLVLALSVLVGMYLFVIVLTGCLSVNDLTRLFNRRNTKTPALSMDEK